MKPSDRLNPVKVGPCVNCGLDLLEVDLVYNGKKWGRGLIHTNVPEKSVTAIDRCTATRSTT